MEGREEGRIDRGIEGCLHITHRRKDKLNTHRRKDRYTWKEG